MSILLWFLVLLIQYGWRDIALAHENAATCPELWRWLARASAVLLR
jgi:hypothetical protein